MVEEKVVRRASHFVPSSHTAAGNDEVDVRMKQRRISSPRVQHSEEAEFNLSGTRDLAGRGRSVSCARREDGIKADLLRLRTRPHLLRNREGHQEVMHGQQAVGLFLQPVLSLLVLAVPDNAGCHTNVPPSDR